MKKKIYKCSNCGSDIEKYISYIERRNVKLIYCNRKCKDEHQSRTGRGSNNPNYKDGNTLETKCKCGNPKDYRAKRCSICSCKSFPIHKKKLDLNEIIALISNSKSFLDACDKSSYSRQYLKKTCEEYDIDISHFVSCNSRPLSYEKIFCIKNKRQNSVVKKYILKNNLIEYICSECGQKPIWNGKELILQLDHINGNPLDDRFENLRFLCPSCHSQTDSYTGRNSRNDR
jgi:hypothetical protein